MSVFRLTGMNGMRLFVILVFPFTAVTGELLSYGREGGEVSLPCTNVITNHHECDTTTWIFNHCGKGETEELVKLGKIGENVFTKAKAARLNVSSDCSLVIKKLGAEDIGPYFCRQFISGNQGSDAMVELLLIRLTEQQDRDELTLHCFVSTWRSCKEKLTWLFDGETLTKSNSTIKITPSLCNTVVVVRTTNNKLKERFKCQVTDPTGKVQTFGFTPQSSGKKTTRPTTTNADPSEPAAPSTGSSTVLLYSLVAAALAALLIVVVVITCWKRARGKEKTTKANDGLAVVSDFNPAVNQSDAATSQDKADYDSGLTYASIIHSKKKKAAGKAQVKGDGEDEDGTVTYATVKASSDSAGDSADLYATVNESNK